MVASLGYLNYPIVPCTLVLTGSQESHQEFANYSQCNSIFFSYKGEVLRDRTGPSPGPYGSGQIILEDKLGIKYQIGRMSGLAEFLI